MERSDTRTREISMRAIALAAVVALVVALVPAGALATSSTENSEGTAATEEHEGVIEGESENEQEDGEDEDEDSVGETDADEEVDFDENSGAHDGDAPLMIASEEDGQLTGQDGAHIQYIDNTVDNSVSYVTAVVHITGTGGEQAGYSSGKTVYSKSFSVTYSNANPAEVQAAISEASNEARSIAQGIRDRGKNGDFSVTTTESTGQVWDNRVYTNETDGNSILIGDEDYLGGAYGVNDVHALKFVASGDYGKETFYRIEVSGWVNGYDITVGDDGFGTGSASSTTSLAGETVTLSAAPQDGNGFSTWEVVSGDAALASTTDASTTFTMPASDVELKALFNDGDSASVSFTVSEAQASTAAGSPSSAGGKVSDGTVAHTGDSFAVLALAIAIALACGAAVALHAGAFQMRDERYRGKNAKE